MVEAGDSSDPGVRPDGEEEEDGADGGGIKNIELSG